MTNLPEKFDKFDARKARDTVGGLADKLVSWTDKASERISPSRGEDSLSSTPEALARPTILFGAWALIAFFGIFGVWAAFVPLNAAAVATGTVILDANKKTVQHLEGGIVDTIYIKEGQFVKKGDPLIRLDETAAKARYEVLKSQFITAKATEARLLAERDSKDTMTFPKELIDLRGKNQVVTESLDTQERLFESRRKNIEGQTSVLNQKIEQSKREIEGLNAQQTAAGNQVGLLNEEIGAVRKLLAQGNASKPRLLQLERQAADLSGQRGQYLAMISRANQTIAESQIQILNLQNDFQNKVNEDLKDTQASLADLDERIRASADTVNRIMITAPLDGTVTDLKVHTVGGVIQPGAKITDIVPQNDKLIVEAKVQVQDIDVVHAGLKANVRLTAYKSRRVPPVDGTVEQISADRFVDERTGQPYYLARVTVDEDELKKMEDVKLYPGMPADVLIVTGSRTFLQYLFSPITDAFTKAFREQ